MILVNALNKLVCAIAHSLWFLHKQAFKKNVFIITAQLVLTIYSSHHLFSAPYDGGSGKHPSRQLLTLSPPSWTGP